MRRIRLMARFVNHRQTGAACAADRHGFQRLYRSSWDIVSVPAGERQRPEPVQRLLDLASLAPCAAKCPRDQCRPIGG